MDIKTYVEGLEWSPFTVIKLVGIVLGALFVAALTLSVLNAVSSNVSGVSLLKPQMASYDGAAYDYAVTDGYGIGGGAPELSMRNVASIYPPQPYPGGTIGDEAEEFEVMQYSVSIKTGDAEGDCSAIGELKAQEYVIFESANTHERGCSFTFKVAKANVAEIVAFLEKFDPEDLSEQVYTIARQIKDYTSEEDILKAKLETVTDTLASATDAYDDITALAIRTNDADSLARVIESKLQIIERLTQERINVSAQLDRLSRAKALELDRLEYTYFNVSVYEAKIVNAEAIRDAWRAAAVSAVSDINRVLTEVTLGLVALIFLIAQWLLYAVILVVVAKMAWRLAVRFWHA
jgi:hypothetical protein